jgi:galactose-6-phosphate isomerase
MKIAIGCDHIVTHMKDHMVQYLTKKGHKVIDCGTYGDVRTHYDIYGFEVARQVVTKQAEVGIVMCGTGVGITNSAQKVKGTRVCLTRDVEVARKSKELYNCNILGMGGNIVGIGLMEAIVDVFLSTRHKGGNKATIKAIDSRISKPNYNTHQFDGKIKE